jgi:uncharacterized protein YbaP (TraB family)
MILTWLKRGVAALSIAATAALPTLAPARTPAPSARPALWQVSDRDTRIYLFGTIHLLPENYAWQSAKLDKAVRQSQQLYIETMVDEKNPMALFGELQRLGISPNLPALTERVAPEKRAALTAAVAASGVPMAAYNRLETWAAAFLLIGSQFKTMGLRNSEGVESVLRRSFTAAGKPIGQLETNAEQLGFFDMLPEAAQRTLLEGALERPDKVRGQFTDMLGAWARGDVASIARTFNSEMEGSPALMDSLIARRNANWARWIGQRMQQPGTLLVAVGAGHLAGEGSVQAMLTKSGYKVTRVQ